MEDKILQRAKEIFGEHRFEEIMGELWLQRARILERAILKAWPEDPAGALDAVLREWEDRFRRDTEEGRVQDKAGRRRRVLRFCEVLPFEDWGQSPEDALAPRVRRRF
jgi:hypothetical protein